MKRQHIYWLVGGLVLYWIWRRSTIKVVTAQEYYAAKGAVPSNNGATLAPPPKSQQVWADGYNTGQVAITGGALRY